MKQKIIIAVFLGLAVGVSGTILNQPVAAQGVTLEDCQKIPTEEGKKSCIDSLPGETKPATQSSQDCSTKLDPEAARACEVGKRAILEEKCASIDDNTEKDVKDECKKANLYSGDGTKCAGVETSIISGAMCDDSKEGGVIFSLLKWVLGIMTAGVGITAVGGIAYGALLYTTAESKPEQTKKAIGIITNVVIGLVAYALMAVLLNFIIPGGVIG